MATISLKSSAHHMVESLGLTRTPPPAAPDVEDPFHDPLLRWIGIAFVVMALAIVALTGLIHWGVEYQSPSWNSHAYPPAIVH